MILFLLAGSEVCGQLGITIQPVPQAICAGDAASFSVVVSGGTGTLSYQWYVDGAQVINGVNISGSRSAALTFNPAFAGDAGSYNVVVTDDTGDLPSDAATLTVNTSPAITISPATQTVGIGASVTLTAAAGGSPAPLVQWQVSTDGGAIFADIADQTSTTLTFTTTVAQNGNKYRAIFSNPCGSAFSTAATLTVNPLPSLSITSTNVIEGNSGTTKAVLTVSLSAPKSREVRVNWATADNSASAPADYQANSGLLKFLPGTTSLTVTNIVNGDNVMELNETFTVVLSNPVEATIATDGHGSVTILNDDAPPQLTINNVIVTEGDTGTTNVLFTVNLSAPSGLPVSVDWAIADGTAAAGSDYIAANGTLSFDPAQAPSELPPQGTPPATTVSVAPLLQIRISDQDVVISASVSLEGYDLQAKDDLSDNSEWTIVTGEAKFLGNAFVIPKVGSRFYRLQRQAVPPIMFPPGETSKTIAITVNGDTLNEADETFFVNLSNAVGATIGDGQGAGTIRDDDLAPSVLITDAVVLEGNSGTTTNLVFQVRLSTASGQTISVDYATTNGTATAGSDYLPANGTLTFTPGTILQTVAVRVNGDDLVEPDETVLVNLSNIANATIGRGQGVGKILNDEALPSLTVTDASVTEGDSGTTNAVFTVLLSIASSQTVTVDFATADGTAMTGSDYLAVSRTLSFPPGTTTTNVSVQVIGDTIQEPDEVFNVRLTNAVNATIARGQGQGAIRNDDNQSIFPD